jgi:imidazolonepropionase-like amidohydrolase
MVEGGVRVVAGTDATSHLVIPGFSMHDELQALVRCGMQPAAALAAATAVAAELLGSEAGVIEAGRPADLVLLSANPLEEIGNTARIEAVILDGRLVERRDLDAMLAAVRDAHAQSRNFDIARYR